MNRHIFKAIVQTLELAATQRLAETDVQAHANRYDILYDFVDHDGPCFLVQYAPDETPVSIQLVATRHSEYPA